jgi:hypothetical protein
MSPKSSAGGLTSLAMMFRRRSSTSSNDMAEGSGSLRCGWLDVVDIADRTADLASDGGVLETLDQARTYILNLPKAAHDAPAWRTAIRALLLVGDNGEAPDFTRMMQAHTERAEVRSGKGNQRGVESGARRLARIISGRRCSYHRTFEAFRSIESVPKWRT